MAVEVLAMIQDDPNEKAQFMVMSPGGMVGFIDVSNMHTPQHLVLAYHKDQEPVLYKAEALNEKADVEIKPDDIINQKNIFKVLAVGDTKRFSYTDSDGDIINIVMRNVGDSPLTHAKLN